MRPAAKIKFEPVVCEDKLDEVKLELCMAIRRVAGREGWTASEMAIYCGTNETRIGHVMSKKFKSLTVNQLIRYLIVLYPRFRILIATG